MIQKIQISMMINIMTKIKGLWILRNKSRKPQNTKENTKKNIQVKIYSTKTYLPETPCGHHFCQICEKSLLLVPGSIRLCCLSFAILQSPLHPSLEEKIRVEKYVESKGMQIVFSLYHICTWEICRGSRPYPDSRWPSAGFVLTPLEFLNPRKFR